MVPGPSISPVRCLAFSPDGKYLAAGGHSNIVTVWELSTGKSLGRFSGHTNWVVALEFSPDSRHLVSASRDRTVHVWDLQAIGKRLAELGLAWDLPLPPPPPSGSPPPRPLQVKVRSR